MRLAQHAIGREILGLLAAACLIGAPPPGAQTVATDNAGSTTPVAAGAGDTIATDTPLPSTQSLDTSSLTSDQLPQRQHRAVDRDRTL